MEITALEITDLVIIQPYEHITTCMCGEAWDKTLVGI